MDSSVLLAPDSVGVDGGNAQRHHRCSSPYTKHLLWLLRLLLLLLRRYCFCFPSVDRSGSHLVAGVMRTLTRGFGGRKAWE